MDFPLSPTFSQSPGKVKAPEEQQQQQQPKQQNRTNTAERVHCRTESEKRETAALDKVVEVQSGGGLHFTSLRTCRSIRDVLRLTAAAAVLAAGAGVSGTRRHEGSIG